MGSDFSSLSAAQVGDEVSKLGEAYEPYRDICIKNGIDGEAAQDLEDDDLEVYGVTM